MSIFSIPLSVILIIIMVVLLIIYCGKTPKFFVEKEGIFIKDFLYPSRIFAETIKSVTLCDVMPKVLMRTNGYGGISKWKGFFQIKKDKVRSSIFYLENHKNGLFIEIETTNRLYYINLKNEEQTRYLYDEIKSKVKFVDEKDLIIVKDNAPVYRSVIIIFVFLFIVTAVSMLPLLGINS